MGSLNVMHVSCSNEMLQFCKVQPEYLSSNVKVNIFFQSHYTIQQNEQFDFLISNYTYRFFMQNKYVNEASTIYYLNVPKVTGATNVSVDFFSS